MELIDAIKRNQLEEVKTLLDGGADIHADQNSVIIHAVDTRNLHLVQLLIDGGATLQSCSSIYHALCVGDLEMFKLLIRNGADFTFNLHNSLIGACRSGNREVIEYVMQKYASRTQKNEIFIQSAQKGFDQAVQVLLDDPECSVDINTALEAAICNSKMEVTKFLMSRGADILGVGRNLLVYISSTPNSIVRSDDRLEIIKFLLASGVDSSHRNHAAFYYAQEAKQEAKQETIAKFLGEWKLWKHTVLTTDVLLQIKKMDKNLLVELFDIFMSTVHIMCGGKMEGFSESLKNGFPESLERMISICAILPDVDFGERGSELRNYICQVQSLLSGTVVIPSLSQIIISYI